MAIHTIKYEFFEKARIAIPLSNENPQA